MNIPIAKPMMGEEEIAAVQRVLASGQLAAGPHVRVFEDAFAIYQERKYGVAVTSGTTALEAAVSALFPIAGRDEIIVPAMSFNATSSAVIAAGYRPVFVDVKINDLTIDPVEVFRAINGRTRAIIPVHLHGQMADMDQLDSFGVDLIEDAAQAHDSYLGSRRPGSWKNSKMQCYSFYATKAITTGGEGGMVLTDNKEYCDTLRLIREHGAVDKYVHVRPGHNWRMTEMQAAIGIEQLLKLPKWQAARYQNYLRYERDLTYMVGKPYIDPHDTHSWHQYVIRVEPEYRDAYIRGLTAAGIGTGIHYPMADPRQIMYGYREFAFPNAEHAAEKMISLPIGPWLTENDMTYIIENLNRISREITGVAA